MANLPILSWHRAPHPGDSVWARPSRSPFSLAASAPCLSSGGKTEALGGLSMPSPPSTTGSLLTAGRSHLRAKTGTGADPSQHMVPSGLSPAAPSTTGRPRSGVNVHWTESDRRSQSNADSGEWRGRSTARAQMTGQSLCRTRHPSAPGTTLQPVGPPRLGQQVAFPCNSCLGHSCNECHSSSETRESVGSEGAERRPS